MIGGNVLEHTEGVALRRSSAAVPLVVLLVLVGLSGVAYAGTRTEWWCVRHRVAQMEQLEQTARNLFDPIAADVSVSANCGGDTGERYSHASAFIRARDGVSARVVQRILSEAGWATDPPGRKLALGNYYSPGGTYEIGVSWTTTPDVDYEFVDVSLGISSNH